MTVRANTALIKKLYTKICLKIEACKQVPNLEVPQVDNTGFLIFFFFFFFLMLVIDTRDLPKAKLISGVHFTTIINLSCVKISIQNILV